MSSSSTSSRSRSSTIDESNFFSHNRPFAAWLRKKKKIDFDSLSTSRAKSYFKKFCRKWNAGEVNVEKYERMLVDDADTVVKRTSHTWSFERQNPNV